MRMEDLDTPRVVPGMADDILRTLEQLGLEWDGPVVWQSRQTEAYEAAFKVVSQSNAVNLMRFQTAGGTNILTLFRSTSGSLLLRNDVAAANAPGSIAVSAGAWHEVQVSVTISGASSTVQVTLDGSQVTALTQTLNLGTTPIGRLILGDNNNNRTSQVAYDEVVAS